MRVAIGAVLRMPETELKKRCLYLVDELRFTENLVDALGEEETAIWLSASDEMHKRRLNNILPLELEDEDRNSIEAAGDLAVASKIPIESVRTFLRHFGGVLLGKGWIVNGSFAENDFYELFNDSYNETFVQFLK